MVRNSVRARVCVVVVVVVGGVVGGEEDFVLIKDDNKNHVFQIIHAYVNSDIAA